MSYKSQIGQDKWVCEFFKNKPSGYFLDIGAFDGDIFSNTYALESLGWDGICVEAGKTNYESLIKNRNCICLNLAVSDLIGEVCFDENWTVGKIDGSGGQSVESVTFRKLLKDHKVPRVIDYISLDIEGSEYDALIKFPFRKHDVILWTIEHNSHLDDGEMRDKIRKLMIKNDYNLVPDEISGGLFEDWFINKKYDNN